MIFGFPNTERVLFRNNFLRTVTFQYVFDNVDFNAHKDLVRSTFLEDFPRMNEGKNVSYEINAANGQTPIIKSSTESNGFVLFSNNGLKRINITNTTVILSVLGNGYRTYEDIVPALNKVERLLQQVGVSILKRVSVRKVNILAFSSQENSLSSVFADIFAQGIVNSIEAFPQPDALRQNMHSIVLNKGDYRLNLNYGAPEFDNTQRPLMGSIAIDIDLMKGGNTQISNLVNTTTELNDEIFGVFSWVTSDKMKQEIMGHE